MAIEQHHVDHYREHGYAIVENFLSDNELEGARAELRDLLPGWVEFCEDPSGEKPENWDRPQRTRRGAMSFPFPGTSLNAITLHPELRRLAAEMVGHDDLYCEQSHLTFKCKGHAADRDQEMHCDFGNHTLAYPPNDPAYWQTAYLVFYTDVDLEHAPTAVCSWQHYPEKIRWPAHCSREDRPALYENEVKVTVPAGSLFTYSMRTFHRGTPFLEEGGRLGQFITYAPAAWKWLGIVGWSEQAIRPEFRAWIEGATPEERTTLGFPPPGHVYWTEETLAGVAARYPGMDMEPYRLEPSEGE
ncbi:MAG: phytanoyl-CoA dioxygenase family protein [Myxococcota bacterium]